jgi:hypothetical protein
MARGLRNNNPLNIRHNKDVFQGEVTPSTDKSFKQFTSAAYGYRAAFVTLHTYLVKYKRDTIAKIIAAWAPPEDNNDTENYIKNVSERSKIDCDEVLTARDGDKYIRIVSAMCISENGKKANQADVEAGFKLQNRITR